LGDRLTDILNEIVRKTINKPVSGSLEKFLRWRRRPLIVEPKYDGERVLLWKNDRGFYLANRYATVYTEDLLPLEFVDEIHSGLKVDGLFDGELFAINGNLYDFMRNRGGEKDHKLGLVLFDVLRLDDSDLRFVGLLERKRVLECNVEPNDRLMLIEYVKCESVEDVRRSFDRYVQQGFEGVGVKSCGGYYDRWLKLKRKETYDVAVLGVKKTKTWIEERIPSSFLVGFWDRDKKRFEAVSWVGSGLSWNEKSAIAEILPDLIQDEDRNYVYLKPFLVFEIEAQEVTKRAFRSARVIKIRLDKSPYECVK